MPRKTQKRALFGSGSAIAVAMLAAPQASGQSLDNDYWINVQAYYPKVDTNVRVTADIADTIGTDIDLERDLSLDDRDILPAVTIGSRFGKIVVGFDLCGHLLPVEPQPLNKLLRQARPVHFGVGDKMGVKVTHRAVAFAPYCRDCHLLPGPIQPGNHVRQFLPHGRGACRLTMGACQHRPIRERIGHVGQDRNHLVDSGQQNIVACITNHQGISKIVDILRGAAEMDEFHRSAEFLMPRDFLFKEVFHRFDVMIGGALDCLDGLGVLNREVISDPAEKIFC